VESTSKHCAARLRRSKVTAEPSESRSKPAMSPCRLHALNVNVEQSSNPRLSSARIGYLKRDGFAAELSRTRERGTNMVYDVETRFSRPARSGIFADWTLSGSRKGGRSQNGYDLMLLSTDLKSSFPACLPGVLYVYTTWMNYDTLQGKPLYFLPTKNSVPPGIVCLRFTRASARGSAQRQRLPTVCFGSITVGAGRRRLGKLSMPAAGLVPTNYQKRSLYKRLRLKCRTVP